MRNFNPILEISGKKYETIKFKYSIGHIIT